MNQEQLEKVRAARIKEARISFWVYCQLEDPDFYKAKNAYLKEFCDLLQAFVEHRIVRQKATEVDGDYGWFILARPLSGLEYCQRLIVNMPPRHGKTRTIALLESWVMGLDPGKKVICGSYNDDAAADLSRLVRDKISEKSMQRWRITFNDIFPDVELKRGDSSIKRWSLEGQYFNYLAAGIGGSVTGKGCDLMVIDDPVKSSLIAFNETAMDGINSWIKDTMLSRMEGDAMYILVQTRWPGGDPCEDAHESENANLYYVHSDVAHQGEGKMLNEDILSYKTFCEREKDTDATVFLANYQQIITHPKGALYKLFRTYDMLPKDLETGEAAYDRKIAYGDTADGGGDFTTLICGIEYRKECYVTGVYYKCAPVEESEIQCAELLIQTGTKEAYIESQQGGKAFAKSVDRITKEVYGIPWVNVEWFHQAENKQARILSNASAVQRRVIYPVGWERMWPEYAQAMMKYLRVGRNKNDDAPDATTGIVETMDNMGAVFA